MYNIHELCVPRNSVINNPRVKFSDLKVGDKFCSLLDCGCLTIYTKEATRVVSYCENGKAVHHWSFDGAFTDPERWERESYYATSKLIALGVESQSIYETEVDC